MTHEKYSFFFTFLSVKVQQFKLDTNKGRLMKAIGKLRNVVEMNS